MGHLRYVSLPEGQLICHRLRPQYGYGSSCFYGALRCCLGRSLISQKWIIPYIHHQSGWMGLIILEWIKIGISPTCQDKCPSEIGQLCLKMRYISISSPVFWSLFPASILTWTSHQISPGNFHRLALRLRSLCFAETMRTIRWFPGPFWISRDEGGTWTQLARTSPSFGWKFFRMWVCCWNWVPQIQWLNMIESS